MLASLAVLKQNKATLAPRHARERLAPVIRAERHALQTAAETLHRQVMPHMRKTAEAARARQRVRAAATALQAARRGQVLRRSIAGMRELQRSRNRAAKLRSKRVLASLLRARHEAPICTAAVFAALPPDAILIESDEHEAPRASSAVRLACAQLAAARGWSEAHTARLTARNARRAFDASLWG